MRNVKLVIEYDGTGFVGWQSQVNGRSVQDEIRRVLSQVLQEPVNLIGAGRTDSGVHARGQVANFQTGSKLDTNSIFNALNGLLPDDVYVHSAEEAPKNFHARYDARERVYLYYISLKPVAIGRFYKWFVKYDLDFTVMNTLAKQIVGEHDFEAFCKYDADVDRYRCTVSKSEWLQTADGLQYEVRSNRFLHGMVRALVGTMVDIGRGYIPASAFREIMDGKDCCKAGMAAPPQGLVLEEVIY